MAQFFSCPNLPRRFEEERQKLRCLMTEPDSNALPPQFTCASIKFKDAEANRRLTVRVVHATGTSNRNSATRPEPAILVAKLAHGNETFGQPYTMPPAKDSWRQITESSDVIGERLSHLKVT